MDANSDDPNNNALNDSQPKDRDSCSSSYSDLSPQEQLRFAVQNFDVARIKDLIVLDPNVCRSKPYCQTPIHELCAAYVAMERKPGMKLRFIDVLTLLSQNGGDVNAVDGSRQSPLHILAGGGPGFADVIKVLIANHARVNAQDRSLRTSLHLAVSRGGKNEVAALLDGGADPNLPNATGHTPLHLAAKRKRNGPVLQLLLGAGAHVNHQPRMGRGVHGATPLHVASKLGCPVNVHVLLSHAANAHLVDSSGQTPLHVAAARDISGNGDVVKKLLQAGSSINAQDATNSETPLHKAVAFHMYDNIRVLIQITHRHLRVNAQDAQGNTALHRAADGVTDIASLTLLMRAGSDPTRLNAKGQSPLDRAIRAKNANAVSVIRQFEEMARDGAKQPSPYSVRKLPGMIM